MDKVFDLKIFVTGTLAVCFGTFLMKLGEPQVERLIHSITSR